MSDADDKKTLVVGEGGRPVDQSAGHEVREVPAVGASPAPVVDAEAETPEAMFQDTARFFLVIEDIPYLNRVIVRSLNEAGASESNVLNAKNLAEVTAAIETLKGKEGVKEVVVICDMKFPLTPEDGYNENPRAGIDAIKQLQAYAAESGVEVSIIFNSSETSLRDEDRALIDAAKAADTDGDKAGAVNAIRLMFEGRASKES